MMTKKIKRFFIVMPMAVLIIFPVMGIYGQDIGEDFDSARDATVYDLYDRMRSGRVFHDRSYPPPDERVDCPNCPGGQNRQQNGFFR
ncbi:MAG: hypothetical protein Tsb0021_14680 [Chlamydiales bacterium]